MPSPIEPLEPRTHLSISSADGVLTIIASRRNNLISVQLSQPPAALTVRENDTVRLFSALSLRRIVIRGGAGADNIFCQGTPVPLTISAAGGNDTITGGDAGDRLFGEAGDDQIVGHLGGDAISGGAGSDAALYSDRIRPLVITVGDGLANDGEILTDNLGRPVSERDDVRGDVEIVVGGDADDRISGDALANTLFGGLGDDTLRGGRGNDVLVGETGDDLLLGEDGNDVLMAQEGAGSDTLNGGRGFDIAERDFLSDRLFKIEFVSDIQPFI